MMSKRRRLNPTTIFDPVHREYELGPEIVDIINTTQFQRLRRLRQLATAHWVWLGATHTRFEHSISVAYLAGLLAKGLQRKQPELEITDRQIVLVQMAGLLHDVGHGPFSHLFDDVFLKDSRDAMAHHEQRSVALVDMLLRGSSFEYSAEEIAFVQAMIAPKHGQNGFFYDIVANMDSHLDVDKLEYIKRDARACGLSQGGFDTDTMRIINSARVVQGRICYHHKVYEDIYNVFQTRYRLHTTVYRHPVVVAIHYMVSDVLRLSGLPLEESIKDLDTFCRYDDTILDIIRHSKDKLMRPAQQLLTRIDERQLYKVVDTCKRTKAWTKRPTVKDLVALEPALTEKDVILDYSCVGFTGKADGHPMDMIRFYDSSKPKRSFVVKRQSVSTLLTPRYCEYWTRIIVRDPDKIGLAENAWKTWQASI
ncbi:HD domain-containing protein [bacterium]|nr:HD domain-containing protein [bacterium]